MNAGGIRLQVEFAKGECGCGNVILTVMEEKIIKNWEELKKFFLTGETEEGTWHIVKAGRLSIPGHLFFCFREGDGGINVRQKVLELWIPQTFLNIKNNGHEHLMCPLCRRKIFSAER